MQRLRTTDRVTELQKLAIKQKTHGAGIAHTRWLTHGEPLERNAHNGIIENHEIMRKRLQAEGFEFISDTDTEVIVHLITFNLKRTADLLKAICESIAELQGAYAIAVMEGPT